ncbi:TPA: HIT family protein [Candidatus Woesearchaeota archaeon]|nr:HIT family protein [Candidatus Woesearchaeota archaeon]
MACEYCEIIEGKRSAHRLYEDDKIVCILADQPAAAGHVLVIPKQHAQIFEMLPDKTATHAFKVANKMSIALFETIKAQGTNIITQNGVPAGQRVPHFCINVIARRESDGLLFEWLPKKLSEQEMGTVEMQLKQEIEAKPEATEVVKEEKSEGEKKSEGKEGEKQDSGKEDKKEENYLVRQLKRMP